MKANQSVEKFYPTLRMYTNFAVRTIKKVCSEIGPREAGTEAELKGQNYMAEQVGDAADEVTQESFKLAPRGLLYWVRFCGTLLLIAFAVGICNLVLNFTVFKDAPVNFAAYVLTALPVLGLLSIIFEFVLYKEFLDPFMKKGISHNTYCIRKASGETKRRIILAGHSDSSIEWRLTHLGGSKLLYAGSAYALIGMAYTFAAGVIMLAMHEFIPILMYIDCAFVPGYFIAFFFLNYKICVDGANDNLTGCMAAGAVLKFLGDNGIRFENTEVIAMFSGAEESGLRGAKAAAKLHPEWKDENVETVFVAIDTLKDYEDFTIYTRDMTGVTAHDPRAINLLYNAGLESDLDVAKVPVFLGASDAAAVSQAGIPAVLMAAMNPGPPRYYHTRGDVADILEPKTIEKGIEIALNAVFDFDEKGLG